MGGVSGGLDELEEATIREDGRTEEKGRGKRLTGQVNPHIRGVDGVVLPEWSLVHGRDSRTNVLGASVDGRGISYRSAGSRDR